MSDFELLQHYLRYNPNWSVTIDPWGVYGCVVLTAQHRSGLSKTFIGRRLDRRCELALAWMGEQYP